MMRIISAVICLAFTATIFAHTQDKAERFRLRGLKSAYVLVENINDDVKRDGLNENQIRTDAELNLHKAAIRVLTRDEHLKSPESSYLYINLQIIKLDLDRGYVYHLKVSLMEEAKLERKIVIDKEMTYQPTVQAATWEREVMGKIPPSSLRHIREFVIDLVDEFINDFLAANPK